MLYNILKEFKLRICHISDTHSKLPKLEGRFDCILHTGDFFPNSIAVYSGNKTQEMLFQENWLGNQASNIKNWLRGYPFLFVLGNHDFVHPDRVEQLLNLYGIKATSLHEKIVSHENVNFYGLPYVPYINGMWNYECDEQEMKDHVDDMVGVCNKTYVDVIAAHAPISGKLDWFKTSLGSSIIAEAFDYHIARDMMPSNYLHGHIHESNGVTLRNGMLISNAAVAQNIIEV
jgi:Icc-related predicted phosphoesterase